MTIDKEMVRRANERYEREHPDAKPRHREHGWSNVMGFNNTDDSIKT